MPRKRRKYPAELKAKVALEALREEATMSRAGGSVRRASEPDRQLEAQGPRAGADGLHREARAPGGLARGRDQGAASEDRRARDRAGFFVQGLRSLSHDRRVAMVDPSTRRLSITRQCRLVSIARSSFYYEGRGESPLNLRADAADRRAVSGDAVLRLAADDPLAAPPGLHGGPQARAPPDAAAGPAGRLPTAQDVSAASGAPDLSRTCCAI